MVKVYILMAESRIAIMFGKSPVFASKTEAEMEATRANEEAIKYGCPSWFRVEEYSVSLS